MHQIYLDTTERFQKKVILKKDEEEIDSIQGDIDIVTSIKEILEKNGLGIGDITEFIPNPGPGSFTGIKIGITIANILNWVLEKKSEEELATPNYGKNPNIQKEKTPL